MPGPAEAQAFASGMAAISTVFWTFAQAGAHVVAPAAVYGGTYGFLRNVAARFGVQTDFVDMTDLSQVRAALRPDTRIVYAETLANPTTAVADLPALADLAHRAGALLVVDSTLAPPVVCRPLEHGADLVLHSATKYLGGHSDATGGVVAGAPDLIGELRAVRIDTGGSLAPDEAFLLHRGPGDAAAAGRPPLLHRAGCCHRGGQAPGGTPRSTTRGCPAIPGTTLARRLFDAGPRAPGSGRS